MEQTTRAKIVAALRKPDRPQISELAKQFNAPLTDVWCLYQVEALKDNPHHNDSLKTGKVIYQLRLHPNYSGVRIAKVIGCDATHVSNCRKLLEYLRTDPVTAPDYGPVRRCRTAVPPKVEAEVEAEAEPQVAPAPKLTGGSNDYYKVVVASPTNGGSGYAAECNDIIESLGMTFAEGNIMKALWRRAALRNGGGKPGSTSLYESEKIEFFAKRLVAFDREHA